MILNEKENFNTNKFVDNLINEGALRWADETMDSFNDQYILPPFFNESLFHKGQKFYSKYIFSMYFAKFMGLLVILSIPTILNILISTNKSSTSKAAYKRYVETIIHMHIWYTHNFKAGSKSWKSLNEVRIKHNSASKKAHFCNIGRISQKDMALTQFGFIGFVIGRPKQIGIFNTTEEECEGFIHFWRVIGYILGIEDRFNICRESVQETREICKCLIVKVFRPAMEKKDPDFIRMGNCLTDAMWFVNPTVNFKVFTTYMYEIMQDPPLDRPDYVNQYIKLNFIENLHLKILFFISYALRFTIVRLFFNTTQYATLWLIKYFPFLAYYYYGVSYSHVEVCKGNF